MMQEHLYGRILPLCVITVITIITHQVIRCGTHPIPSPDPSLCTVTGQTRLRAAFIASGLTTLMGVPAA
jgi:hypothetical protein